MAAQKPRVVIIGAGMAGLVAAQKLYQAAASKGAFDLCVVEGGNRIGGRICTSEFADNQIEMGATWIHGIDGSPVYKIAKETGALESLKTWERMDGFPRDPLIIAEGGFKIDPSIVESISNLYKKLMEFANGKLDEGDDYYALASNALKSCAKNGRMEAVSIGAFLRRGLEAYWANAKPKEGFSRDGNCNHRLLEEALFSVHENMERSITAANDLFDLDFNAMREYQTFPGDEITIAKGYSSIIQSIASALPDGLIQLCKNVNRIEWQLSEASNMQDSGRTKPVKAVKLHFDDGSTMEADHVIVTVSLGVLKAGSMFSPPLPSFKADAISRLGFGVVDKLFLQSDQENKHRLLHLAFQPSDSKAKSEKVPWWMRKTYKLYPHHCSSNILLSWFVGEEALELERLTDEEIINGVSTTISAFVDSDGNGNPGENSRRYSFTKVVKSGWGTNPLFRGSYSYAAVGSSGEDFDTMAKPLPSISKEGVPPLQILFAGEATHRTHYSTTHGAYISGIREANRLLQHYQCGELVDILDH